jgi:hypothetical protein
MYDVGVKIIVRVEILVQRSVWVDWVQRANFVVDICMQHIRSISTHQHLFVHL